MTCKHDDPINNPSCTSYRTPERQAADLAKAREEVMQRFNIPSTPDSANFDVEEVAEIGCHLVLKVRYPNCQKCSYEGAKVMVFANSSLKDAIRWKKIDPHFREPDVVPNHLTAPSPIARFPASKEGWDLAIAFARGVMKQVARPL